MNLNVSSNGSSDKLTKTIAQVISLITDFDTPISITMINDTVMQEDEIDITGQDIGSWGTNVNRLLPESTVVESEDVYSVSLLISKKGSPITVSYEGTRKQVRAFLTVLGTYLELNHEIDNNNIKWSEK